MENWSYKNENIERKYFKTMWRKQFLKVKNSLLDLEKRFHRTERYRSKNKKRDRRTIF